MRYLYLIAFLLIPVLSHAVVDVNAGRDAGINVLEVTCADSGDANPGAITITPSNASMVLVTNSDTNGCDLTLGESGVNVGHEVTITVVSNTGGTVDIADATGVYEGAGNTTLGLWDVVSIQYASDRWIEVSESNN